MTSFHAHEIHDCAGQGPGGLLLLCDHASNFVPAPYGNLGLPASEFARHIAYDIGARDLTLGLARRLGATAILTCYSRLLIDPNRGLDDPTLIMQLSDGAVVQGNAAIDAGERQHRIESYYLPYHRAVTAAIDAMLAKGVVPVILSLHSFTPRWKDFDRPWHAGILWDRDGRLPLRLIEGLRRYGDIAVGDNEPYSGALPGDTMSVHGTARGLPHALIEVRQDLIACKSGVDDWVERLARVIEPILNDASVRRIAQG